MNAVTFDGRVAVVTGAGGGLGRTYARELARRGARVVINDLGSRPDGTGAAADAAQATVDEIVAAGGEAVPDTNSVATPEGGEAVIATAIEAFGRIDILINNAGILRDKSFVKLDPADLDAVLNVHLRGAFFVTQPAFRHMKERGYGRVLFTASAAGLFGNFGQSNYAAAKMGLVGLSSVVAVEGTRAGITSNVIAPIARTRLTEELLGPFAEALDPELVTPLAVYLVSEHCALTHEVFSAGAGRYARAFVGLTPGWFAGKGVRPSVEELADHLGEIRAEDGYIVPTDISAELELLIKHLAES